MDVEREDATEQTIGSVTGSAANANQQQFSHLFPSHLYLKDNNAGEMIDHNEEVLDENSKEDFEGRNYEPKQAVLGQEVTASSYERMPVNLFGK